MSPKLNCSVPRSGGGGGYLVERWVRGCAAQIGCLFGLSGLPMAPFLFENWFRYRSRFCKMPNFLWIFPLVYLQVVKKDLFIPIYMVKSTDWFTNGPSRNKWFRHRRLQICVLWFSYRVVVETLGRTFVPNSKLSTPQAKIRGSHPIICCMHRKNHTIDVLHVQFMYWLQELNVPC